MKGIIGCRTELERKTLGEAIKRDLLAGMDGRGTLSLRWETDTRFFNNDPEPWKNPYMPKAQMLHFPLTRPRINRLSGVTVRTLCQPDTMLVGKMFGQSQRVEELEDCLQTFSEIGGFESRLRQAADIAGCTEHAIIRTRFDAITSDNEDGIPDGVVTMFGNLRYLGFLFDVIHPSDFSVYPNTPYGIAHAQTCGHRYWQTVGQVKSKKQLRRYFADAKITASMGPGQYHQSRTGSSSHSYSDEDTQWVECWEVITRRRLTPGGKLKRYLVRMDWNSGDILSIEEFNQMPWYTRMGFLPKQTNSWWNDTTVAYTLRPLQLAYSALNNLFLYGMHVSAIPPVIGDGLPEKTVQYFAGDVIGKTGDGPITVVNSQFRTQEFPMMLSLIERLADMTVHVAGVSTGGQMQANTTAREVQAVQEGQQRGENDFLVTFGSPIAEIWNIMREQLWLNFAVWRPVVGDTVKIQDRNTLVKQVRWEIHGRNAETTPELELLKYEKLLEKAVFFGDIQGRIPGHQGGVDPKTGAPMPPTIGPFDVYEILRSYVNRTQIVNQEKVFPMGSSENALGPQFGPDFLNQLSVISNQHGFGGVAQQAIPA